MYIGYSLKTWIVLGVYLSSLPIILFITLHDFSEHADGFQIVHNSCPFQLFSVWIDCYFYISDLIWKIMHGAIPTGRFLYGCKYSDSPNCNYCGELDDLTHIFVTCSRLSGLFQLTQSLIRKLTPTIDKINVWWYIIGIPASAGLDVNVRRLWNWIFAQAKIAIVYSRFNKYKSSVIQCVVTLFKAEVISRVNVEYQFARFQNTVCNFVERWNTYNVLGKVENDNIVYNL